MLACNVQRCASMHVLNVCICSSLQQQRCGLHSAHTCTAVKSGHALLIQRVHKSAMADKRFYKVCVVALQAATGMQRCRTLL